MKILAFSDLHNGRKAARKLVDLASSVDVVIGAGDFCNCQRGVENVISVLAEIETPTLLVPGNSETPEMLSGACSEWTNSTVLHGTSVEIMGLRFFGIGGGIPVTPFGSWSFDLTEEQADVLLQKAVGADVLISHSPPFGILDISSRGVHLGSRSVAQAIKDNQIELTICGHIHHSWNSIEKSENGAVINAGPYGMIWDTTSKSLC